MAADGHLNFDTKLDESGFKSGIGKLGSIAKGGLTVLGGAIAGVASAIGAGSAAAIKVGSDFEAGMSKVSAISGATGSELQNLDALFSLSRTIFFSTYAHNTVGGHMVPSIQRCHYLQPFPVLLI